MSKMPTIKPGEPQPIDCPKCNISHGYQFEDYMKVHYREIYEADGIKWGGAYSDGCSMINEGTTAYCSNCASRLPFKIDRN